MKKIGIDDFKKRGYKIFEIMGTDQLRIVGREGRYINMFYHNTRDEEWKKEGEYLITKEGKKFLECSRCGSIHRVRYTIPYDGSCAPGAYCYYCRKKYSIMDIKDAKRYGKVL